MAEYHSLGGNKRGRTGSPNKRTVETIERLKQLGCDPMEFSAKVMMGKELKGDHPAAGTIITAITKIETMFLDERNDRETLKARIVELRELVLSLLIKTTTPIDIRSKHALELLKYVAPQLKAIDVSAHLQDGTLHLHFDSQDKDA